MGKIKIPLLIIIVLLIILIVAAIVFKIFKLGPMGTEKITLPSEVYGISGTIKEINTDSLIVDALLLPENPSDSPIRQKVTVFIDDATKITKLEFPDAENLTQEEIEQGFQPQETEIGLAELKENDTVNIATTENISDNLKNKIPFTATFINVVVE